MIRDHFWDCPEARALFKFEVVQYCHLWKDQFQLLSTFLVLKPDLQILLFLSQILDLFAQLILEIN